MVDSSIVVCEWGKIVVNDSEKGKVSYKDCKLYYSDGKTESKNWDWNISGTHHDPGVQRVDLHDMDTKLNGAILLLSTGYDNCLKITPELIEYLKTNKMEYMIANTEEIITWYKKLVDANKKVVALIHTTC
jgi:hypothetical protein